MEKILTITCLHKNVISFRTEIGSEMLWILFQIKSLASSSKIYSQKEKCVVTKMRLDVEAIPEIVSIFAKSKNVYYMNGRTHFLMRRQLENRKRKIHDIEMDLNEETKNEIKNYKEKINDLQKEIEQY